MPTYRILIVDDQREVRRVLRAGLETLPGDVQVDDVPSGEEAILLMNMQPVDLLVADILLPGISGFELQQRALSRNPNLKLILITGLPDSKTRRQVAEAGAFTYFYKPVEMIDFLEAVQSCLGMSPASLPPAPVNREEREIEPALGQDVPSLLIHWRQETGALAILLFDERAEVLGASGDLPGFLSAKELLQQLWGCLQAAFPVERAIGSMKATSTILFSAQGYNLVLFPVSSSLALLVVMPPGWLDRLPAAVLRSLTALAEATVTALARAAKTPDLEILQASSDQTVQAQEEINLDEVLPEIDALFDGASQHNLAGKDVDAFWDQLVSDVDEQGAQDGDALSYEQARRLGLTPGEK